jgi:hypothetical protein
MINFQIFRSAIAALMATISVIRSPVILGALVVDRRWKITNRPSGLFY